MKHKTETFLNKCRKSKNLKIKELADQIGIARTSLSAIEHKRITCGELVARRLGDYFDMDWALFLSEKKI